MSTSYRLFHSTLQSCHIVFPNGTKGHFIGGKYATQSAAEIAYLEQEISAGNPYLYIDPNQKEIDYDHRDPMAELRAKFFKEFQEQQGKQIDGGTYTQGPLKPITSRDIAKVAAG